MNILVFEDAPVKMESFQELLNLKLNHEHGIEIKFHICTDDSNLESDLLINDFIMVLIDDDLGDDLSGKYVIRKIILTMETTPGCTKIPIVYYSAGTPVTELIQNSKEFGAIPCVSYENLSDYIYNYVSNKLLS
jgi:hypothetical protein